MLSLNDFAIRQVFHRVKDDEGNPIYYRSVAGGDRGYLLVWPDGQTHHTYKHPVDYSGFEYWRWDDED